MFRSVKVSLGFVFLVLSPITGLTQPYPNKPIRIVATEAGGTGDIVARLFARELSGPVGQAIVVENRANGNIRGETVARATADGYTLLVTGATHWVAPFLQKTPYDPVKDFAPISLIYSSQSILFVHPSVSVNSVKELIALAKSKPGALNYASTSVGSTPHLSGELFKALAGVDIVNVPYKGTAQALNAFLGGEVQMMFVPAASATGLLKAGKMRVLAITSAQPSALFPDVPAIAAQLPGFDASNTNGMLAPAKTPRPIVNRLNQEVVQLLNRGDIKEQFAKLGAEVIPCSPAEFSKVIRTEMEKWGRVIKTAGIKLE